MRIASKASLILRVKETSLVRRKFFATCWVIVDAPCGRRLEPKFCAYDHGRARHAGEVDAAMLVEVLVLGREERVGDEFWHRLDRQIEAPLLGVFAEQRTVGRMHARHHRRLVILKLRIVRQVPGEIPDPARDAGHAHQEHDRPGGEQETQKPDQQSALSKFHSNPCTVTAGACPRVHRTFPLPRHGSLRSAGSKHLITQCPKIRLEVVNASCGSVKPAGSGRMILPPTSGWYPCWYPCGYPCGARPSASATPMTE